MRIGNALRHLAALLLALCAGSLAAQTFDLDRGREPVASLDGLWRFQPGDSPVHNGVPDWAAPGFDDSEWPLLRGGRPWSSQGYPGMSGYAWYRCQIRIPAGEGPVSLLFAPLMSGFTVYVDSHMAGGAGTMPPTSTPNPSLRYLLLPLTAQASPSPRTVHVALRVWHSPMWAGYVGGGFYWPGSVAGDPALLAAEKQHTDNLRYVRFVDQYAYSIASGLIGIAILWLFLIRPVDREYLWFAILVLAQCADCAFFIAKEVWAIPPPPVFDFIDGVFNATVFAAYLFFVTRVLQAPIGRRATAVILLLAATPFCAVLYWPGWASPATSAALQLSLLMPAILWPIYLLVQGALRGNRDARLLLLPTLAASGYYAFDNLVMLLTQAGLVTRPEWIDRPLPLPPFAIRIQTALYLVFLLAMLLFLIRRFTRGRQREERMAGEFEAARQVQQMLLPDELDQCAGFRVESIYRPADQVGGDFFQQIADSDGGMLIVVGDVSGKGLPAAMIVSVLVGAIRAEAAHGVDPAALLRSLNERLIGRSQGGFVTCLAAHLSAGGLLTVANAGHLPPYLNLQEIGVPGALPLGLVPRVDYDLTSTQLAPGDRLTFLSDGVVEAQSRDGELLGFERARILSRESAAAIARAAQEFGQQDDITVVTVEFMGIPCEGPAETRIDESSEHVARDATRA